MSTLPHRLVMRLRDDLPDSPDFYYCTRLAREILGAPPEYDLLLGAIDELVQERTAISEMQEELDELQASHEALHTLLVRLLNFAHPALDASPISLNEELTDMVERVLNGPVNRFLDSNIVGENGLPRKSTHCGPRLSTYELLRALRENRPPIPHEVVPEENEP